MRHPPVALVAFLTVVFVPVPGSAQTTSAAPTPWEFGAGVGLGVNEPGEAFDDCNPSSTRGALFVRGSYDAAPWLRAEVTAGTHGQVGSELCLLPAGYPIPGTHREYPAEVQDGSEYVTTGARLVVAPISSPGSLRPLLFVGLGRIWGRDLHYPELGVGVELALGGLKLRGEALGRWLSVPYDRVRLERTGEGDVMETRTRLDEDHFPILFRIGVGWRP